MADEGPENDEQGENNKGRTVFGIGLPAAVQAASKASATPPVARPPAPVAGRPAPAPVRRPQEPDDALLRKPGAAVPDNSHTLHALPGQLVGVVTGQTIPVRAPERDDTALRRPQTGDYSATTPDLGPQMRATRVAGHGGLEGPPEPRAHIRLIAGKPIPGTRYRLLRWLGEGGMGVVYEAEHIDIERRVALKILRAELSERSDTAQVFREEARAAAKAGSKNNVEIFDFGELPDGRLFTATKLEGEPVLLLAADDGQGPATGQLEHARAPRATRRRLDHRDDRLLSLLLTGDLGPAAAYSERLRSGAPLTRGELERFRWTGELGGPASGERRLLCGCVGLTRGELGELQAAGCAAVEAVSARTGAGSVCGGCVPLIRRLLADPTSEAARASDEVDLAGLEASLDELRHVDGARSLVGPESMTWTVFGESVAILGGARALLMQFAHPAAQGFAEHSSLLTDAGRRFHSTLQSMYGLPLSLTAMVVTGYMLCGAGGMVVGGFLVGRVQRLEKVISVCLLGSAVLLALVGTGLLPGIAALVVASIAGLGTGLAGPSRDMLIKRAAPPGATGRVYGTVYSGLDLGFCLAAPVFGAMLDRGMTSGIFFGSAATLALSVVSAALVGVGLAARMARPAAVTVG